MDPITSGLREFSSDLVGSQTCGHGMDMSEEELING